MAVNENLTNYDTATASMTPAGSDTVGPDLDDHLRSMKVNVGVAWKHSNSSHSRGRLWFDQSASPVVTLKYSDGGQNIPILEIDEDTASARSTPYVGTVKMGTFGLDAAADDTTASGVSRLALPDGISGHIESISAKDYVLIQSSPYKFRMDNLLAEASAGSATVVLMMDGVTAGLVATLVEQTEVTGTVTVSATLNTASKLALQVLSGDATDFTFSINGVRL